MPGLPDYNAQNVLNWTTGQVAMPALPAVWLGLLTAAPTGDAGSTGSTEVSGGAYARVQVAGTAATNATTASGNATLHFAATPAWIVAGMTVRDITASSVIPAGTTVLSTTGTTVVMSANASGAGVGNGDSIGLSAWPAATASAGAEPGTTPANLTNGAVITFPQATANWGTVIAWFLADAATVGNWLFWDYLGGFDWIDASVSSASPGVFTTHAHGYAVNDPVVVSAKPGGFVPTFSQSNFTGVLIVAHAATDTIDVTNGGTAVNTSSSGDLTVRKIVQQSIPNNVTASFAASSLTLKLA
jgi:hypothetical protein